MTNYELSDKFSEDRYSVRWDLGQSSKDYLAIGPVIALTLVYPLLLSWRQLFYLRSRWKYCQVFFRLFFVWWWNMDEISFWVFGHLFWLIREPHHRWIQRRVCWICLWLLLWNDVQIFRSWVISKVEDHSVLKDLFWLLT